jgi:hypothetical protein
MKTGALPELGENGSMPSKRIVRYKKASPVKVSDILASGETDRPVRVVVKNDTGQEGYFDLAVSDTNRAVKGREIGDWALGEIMAPSEPDQPHK